MGTPRMKSQECCCMQRTDEEFPLPSRTYRMSGNKIAVRTLDLNCDFAVIRQQLQMIAEEYFT